MVACCAGAGTSTIFTLSEGGGLSSSKLPLLFTWPHQYSPDLFNDHSCRYLFCFLGLVKRWWPAVQELPPLITWPRQKMMACCAGAATPIYLKSSKTVACSCSSCPLYLPDDIKRWWPV
eukprot:1159086-Pelagomonas_calceolata.AAC.5